MSFKFLHTADIHLDSPLTGLALRLEDRAEEIRGASRKAFVNLVETAVEQEVAFLVIAGDLFDGDWKDLKTEAIDLDAEFIWLEDHPFESEKLVLHKAGKIDSLITVDLNRENELRSRQEKIDRISVNLRND